ncbi:MAG: tetratricopeptide repeat protein [Candidatus Sericytochromatia bacterium]
MDALNLTESAAENVLQGRLLLQQESHELACVHFQLALELTPENWDAHLGMAQALLSLQRPEEALAHLQEARRLQPASADILFWLAFAQRRTQAHAQARETCLQALRMAPHHAPCHLELARIDREHLQWAEAERSYRRYLQLQPRDLDVTAELADLLARTDQHEEAGQLYLALYRHQPEQSELLLKWLQVRAQNDPALMLQLMIQLAQEQPHLRSNLALQMATLMEYASETEEAQHCLEMALEDLSLPDRAAWQLRHALHLPYLADSAKTIARAKHELERQLDRLEQGLPEDAAIQSDLSNLHPYLRVWTPFCYMPYLNLDPCISRQRWGKLFQHLLPPQPPLPGPRLHENAPEIGLVLNSNTAVRAFLVELLRRWPLEKAPLQIFLTPLPDGSSPTPGQLRPDLTEHLLSADYGESIQQLRQARLDVLFLSEVHTDRLLQSLLASLRLAPVQVTSWLSSGTTGLNTMDYFLSSHLLEQAENPQRFYSEKLLLLDEIPAFFHAPFVLESPPPRSDYGLPETGRLYLCPHFLYKYHPDFDAALAGILEADPGGFLVLLSRPNNPYLRNRLLQRLERQYPHLLPRIWFLPPMNHADFLGLLQLADVMLDPFYFGGGTTSFEALGLGVPVITWPGERLHGRITHAYYRKLAIDDAVAYHPEDYIRRAVELATQTAWNQDVRGRLLARQSHLFENEAAVSEVVDCLVGLARSNG